MVSRREAALGEVYAMEEGYVPFIIVIVAPGIKGGVAVDQPVSLVDIYPTLIDLCGLPDKKDLDGQSLVPLMKNPNLNWKHPVTSTYHYKNHAIITDKWRYIHYQNDTQELYNEKIDPLDWYNVADDPKNAGVIARLRKWLPTKNIAPAPDMKKPKGVKSSKKFAPWNDQVRGLTK